MPLLGNYYICGISLAARADCTKLFCFTWVVSSLRSCCYLSTRRVQQNAWERGGSGAFDWVWSLVNPPPPTPPSPSPSLSLISYPDLIRSYTGRNVSSAWPWKIWVRDYAFLRPGRWLIVILLYFVDLLLEIEQSEIPGKAELNKALRELEANGIDPESYRVMLSWWRLYHFVCFWVEEQL